MVDWRERARKLTEQGARQRADAWWNGCCRPVTSNRPVP